MAPPRIRITASTGWEVLTPPARTRSLAAETDPFLERVLGDGRLALAGVRSARPRRGAPIRPGSLDARVEAPAAPGWVLVARHPSGALTFHAASAIEGGAHRFEVRFAPQSLPRRGPGAVLRVFLLRFAGAVAGALLPALARAWEKRRFKEARIPLGLVGLSLQDGKLVASRIPRASRPGAPARSLLFLHGTFSHASAAFSDLARDGAFETLSKLYEGRVFAFNHLTVGYSPDENVKALVAAVRGSSLGSSPDSGLDVVTHSRGGLVARLLASSDRAPRLHRVFLAASPNEGTPLASPARWDRLAAWLANLGEMFAGGPLAFGLDFAAEALVWMASRAGGTLPGIAAMDPAGGFLEKLNAASARPYEVAAAIARYEPHGSAARRLLDAAAGVFFEDPNDLVVPTEGGARLGEAPPVPAENVIRFGPGGNAGAGTIVHHLNLFAQRATREGIRDFLEGKKREKTPYSPDVRRQGRASRAAQRSKTLDTG
ncbi:MAG: esterase/lipase family protein, partial [Thermoanaerobaculia bacterium]